MWPSFARSSMLFGAPCSSCVSVWCGKLLGDKQWSCYLYWLQIWERVFLLTQWLWSVDPRGHKLCHPMKVQRKALSLNLRNNSSVIWPHIRTWERVSSVSKVSLQKKIVTIEYIRICMTLCMRGKETWINRHKRKYGDLNFISWRHLKVLSLQFSKDERDLWHSQRPTHLKYFPEGNQTCGLGNFQLN